jgi:hypothetical protein|tara:strand:+ start:90 stop:440 length:351 start_codon:yes stop_codon:yes gene_type:complete
MNNSLVSSSLTDDTKQWITIDNQLKMLNEQQKHLRIQKHLLSSRICENMEKINSNKMALNNVIIKKYEKKDYSPLSYSYIESCLNKIIKNKEHVDLIVKKIKDDRTIKSSFDIKTL